MKSFLALLLIGTLGVFTIGCETKKGTDEFKTKTTTTPNQGRQDNGREDDDDHRHDENDPPGHARRWWHDDREEDRDDHRNDQVVPVMDGWVGDYDVALPHRRSRGRCTRMKRG